VVINDVFRDRNGNTANKCGAIIATGYYGVAVDAGLLYNMVEMSYKK